MPRSPRRRPVPSRPLLLTGRAAALAGVVAALMAPTPAGAVAGGSLTITTVAGTGTAGYTNGDSWGAGTIGVAESARFNQTSSTATDAAGNLYIADYGNCRVRKVDVAGLVTDVAGSGTCIAAAPYGDGGAATSATLRNPRDVAIDASGALLIADTGNCRVRKVVGGTISTVAGTTCGFAGDNAAATAAQLSTVDSIAVDTAGNVIVADTGNARVRRVTVADGKIRTIAGTGTTTSSGDGGPATAAGMDPEAVAVSLFGNLVVADRGNHRVRMFAPGGTIVTVAGTGVAGYSTGGVGNVATNAKINFPNDVAVDGAGNLFIGDTLNCRVRKVTPASVISDLAGTGTCGDTGEDGAATAAQIGLVSGVSTDRSGSVLASYSNRVKAVLGGAVSTYPAIDSRLTTRFRTYGDTVGTTANWSGGDGSFSFKLPDSRIAWFFSDSYRGQVAANHTRVVPGSQLIPNQVVIESTTGTMSNAGGASGAYFPAAPGGDKYWPQAANLKDATTLQVLLRRVNSSGVVVGVALAPITLPGFTLGTIVDLSTKAFVNTAPANLCSGSAQKATFGNAIVPVGTDTYIYGEEGCGSQLSGFAYLAKVSGTDLTAAWSYFTGTAAAPAWGTASVATRLQKTGAVPFVEAGHEFSVVKDGSTYRMITSPLSFNPGVHKSTSSNPYGPWSKPVLVFTAPEWGQTDWGPGATCTHFTYNSKEHPAYAGTGRIVISYNVMPSTPCAGGLTDLASNVDNYRPRFIDVAP